MARSDEKRPETILVEFNKECVELGYFPALADSVEKARNKIRKALEGGADYEAASILKGRFMSTFRDDPRMDAFDWRRYHAYASNGERQ